MKVHKYRVAGDPVRVHVVRSPADLPEFRDWLLHNPFLAFDTEGSGLDIFSRTFRLRLAQFGNQDEAWVLPVERGEEYAEAARRALVEATQVTCHNSTFDLLVADIHLGVNADRMALKTLDTRILSHLIDPRARHEGGTGHGLKELAEHYVDPQAPDTQAGLKAAFKELGLRQSEGWALIPLDHPVYELYAGLDTILTARLERRLLPLVPSSAQRLIAEEHEIARICMAMEKTGFLIDEEYSRDLAAYLADEEERWMEQAYILGGVENVNSTQQVAEALMAKGVTITDTTPTGKPKVDKALLERLEEQGNGLATAVIRAKRAGKWRKTWVLKFLDEMDAAGRVHPRIGTLAARTGRMSITGVPAQTLPASDSLIRSCFVAETGHRIGSIDYQTQELRVLAALSGDPVLKKAFRDGLDLHQITADVAGVDRKVAKAANFGWCYGIGPKALRDQVNIPLDMAKKVLKGMERTYRRAKEYSEELQAEAREAGYITTISGRRLPVDRNRIYSALNYAVQSTSRDVTCRGLIEIDRKGLTELLRLPVHDEVVGSFPEGSAEYLAGVVGECMTMTLRGVELTTDPEIGGRSWGSLYEK